MNGQHEYDPSLNDPSLNIVEVIKRQEERDVYQALVRGVLRRGNGWSGLPAHLFPQGKVVQS